MKSRIGQHATLGNDTLSEAFAAEAVDKLREYYLPRLREALAEIDDEQLWRRPRPEVNSVGNLMLHLEGNLHQWILSGLGHEPDHRDRDAEFSAMSGPSSQELLKRFETTLRKACEIILLPREDEDWLRPTVVQGFSTTPVSVVLHVVEHVSYHTGQVVLLVKAATGRDLGFYNL